MIEIVFGLGALMALAVAAACWIDERKVRRAFADYMEQHAALEYAIGEHAFGAGWDASHNYFGPSADAGIAKVRAWQDYTPPEELTGGGDV